MVLSVLNANKIFFKKMISHNLKYNPLVAVSPGTKMHVGKNVKISKFCSFSGDIHLGDYSKCGPRCRLHGKVRIGMGTILVENIRIEGAGGVKIGNYCAIGPDLRVFTTNHDYRYAANQLWVYNLVGLPHRKYSKGPVEIGNDVWIGERVIILSGVKIGDGAIIGAGSVVTKDVEPFSIVAGVPAKHIKYRFPREVREKLLEFKWWEKKPHELVKLKELFEEEITDVKKVENLLKLRNK